MKPKRTSNAAPTWKFYEFHFLPLTFLFSYSQSTVSFLFIYLLFKNKHTLKGEKMGF